MQKIRIGVIGANGWLGGAIVEAMLITGVAAPERLTLSYRSATPTRFPQARWTRDNQQLVENSDAIIVSVRPDDWRALAMDARGKLVISVMASVALAPMVEAFRTPRVARAMPNAAAELRCSYTPWFVTLAATEEDRRLVQTIFEACGACDEAASEDEIDYFSGFSGSGQAYPALLAAAMESAALARGVRPEMARRAVVQLMIGAGRLFEAHPESPTEVVETFVRYRGITTAAIETMRANRFDEAVKAGLEAAHRKASGT